MSVVVSRATSLGILAATLPLMGCGSAGASSAHTATDGGDAGVESAGIEGGDEASVSELDATLLDAPLDVIDEIDLPPPPDAPVLPWPGAPYSGAVCTPGQKCDFVLGAPGCGDTCTCGFDASWAVCKITCAP